MAPLALALQKAAAPLIARPVHAKSTRRDLEAADLKFEVLNYPAVRALLSEEQQSQVGAVSWTLRRNLWTKDNDRWVARKRRLDKTIEAIARELEDGRKVWFFMPLFGELAGDLMEAVLEHGARNVAVMSARGVRTVDMEHARIVKAFAARPEARLTVDYLVTDVMTGPRRTDLTETRIGRIAGLAEKAAGIIARALGLRPGALRARSADNVFFPTRESN